MRHFEVVRFLVGGRCQQKTKAPQDDSATPFSATQSMAI